MSKNNGNTCCSQNSGSKRKVKKTAATSRRPATADLSSSERTAVPRRRVAHGHHAHLGWHPVEIVGSLEYDNPPNDFRTNASDESRPRVTQFDSHVEAIAVSSVRSVGMELGGVDVIFGPGGKIYLLEMNMPCGFATFPKLGLDVPGMMVDYLLAKSKRVDSVQEAT
jgi:hypothetical protein